VNVNGKGKGKNAKAVQSELFLVLVNKLLGVMEVDEVCLKFCKKLLTAVDKEREKKLLTVKVIAFFEQTKQAVGKYVIKQ